MNRRKFLTTSFGASAFLVVGGSIGYVQLENNTDLSIATLLLKLKHLNSESMSGNDILFDNNWNAAQTFTHLAQSVEYSMQGYPVHKPELFKSTLGKIAFNVFVKKGSMHHDLADPIPGAPTLLASDSTNLALNRLIKALDAFVSYQGQLKPHFAYGPLNHAQYAKAHVMHVYNHFELLKFPAKQLINRDS